ncbi:large-conductance mechanosensitive channel [Entophlyctis helioformis]|nr:large-conductance mechanosensitive channel [Entophlyctis helioformis]
MNRAASPASPTAPTLTRRTSPVPPAAGTPPPLAHQTSYSNHPSHTHLSARAIAFAQAEAEAAQAQQDEEVQAQAQEGFVNDEDVDEATETDGLMDRVEDIVEDIVVTISETAKAGATVATKQAVDFWTDFGEFVDKGPVVELGIGVVTGTVFSGVLESFVDDILTPPLSFFRTNGSNLRNMFIVLKPGLSNTTNYLTLEQAIADGAVTENVGKFVESLINFFITTMAMFWLIRLYQTARRRIPAIVPEEKEEEAAPPPTKKCQWCRSTIDAEAFRCPNCTSMLDESPAGSGPVVVVGPSSAKQQA